MPAQIPFIFLFAYEACMSRCESSRMDDPATCRSVSVIIPALNEEKNILSCIRSVSNNPRVCEIIVVDAGSGDRTRTLARQAGAHVILHDATIENGGGRGGQICAGISAARGDIVVILHADAVAKKEMVDRMVSVLNHHPAVIGGAAGCRFDCPGRRFRLIELANDFRAAFLKISFGDQAQFFRRQPVVEHNLFPSIPLMEDVEFSIRLHRLGKQVYLFDGVMVSTRRWENVASRNSLWVFVRVVEYLIYRLWSDPDTANLYRKYYGCGNNSGFNDIK